MLFFQRGMRKVAGSTTRGGRFYSQYHPFAPPPTPKNQSDYTTVEEDDSSEMLLVTTSDDVTTEQVSLLRSCIFYFYNRLVISDVVLTNFWIITLKTYLKIVCINLKISSRCFFSFLKLYQNNTDYSPRSDEYHLLYNIN